MGVPGIIDSQFEQIEEADKEWIRILNVMTKGFYLYATKEDYEMSEEDKKIWIEAMEYFKEFFSCLWD